MLYVGIVLVSLGALLGAVAIIQLLRGKITIFGAFLCAGIVAVLLQSGGEMIDNHLHSPLTTHMRE